MQSVIDELKTNPVEPVLATAKSEEDKPRLVKYARALQADPVGKTRDLVAACRVSGQRRYELKKLIKNGNESQVWKKDVGRDIPAVAPLRDCKTRWSSTFLMVDRALILYPVSFPLPRPFCTFVVDSSLPQAIETFLALPTRSDIAHHLLLPDQKSVLTHIYEIFDFPHRAQQVVSHENTPTVSIAMPAYALLVDAWKALRYDLPELQHYIDFGVTKVEEYVFKSRKSRIFALAMSKLPHPVFAIDTDSLSQS